LLLLRRRRLTYASALVGGGARPRDCSNCLLAHTFAPPLAASRLHACCSPVRSRLANVSMRAGGFLSAHTCVCQSNSSQHTFASGANGAERRKGRGSNRGSGCWN